MKKVYCSKCKHCGDIIRYDRYLPITDGNESFNRFCNNNNLISKKEYDTYYEHHEYEAIPMCHVINKNNDCKDFEAK